MLHNPVLYEGCFQRQIMPQAARGRFGQPQPHRPCVRHLGLDAHHEWIYRQTRERFSEFCELDAWNMMASRADLVSSSSSSSSRRRRSSSSSSSRPTRLARTLTLTLLPTPTPTLTEA